MGQGGGILGFPAGDPVRDYTEDEKRALTENLLSVTREVHRGRFDDRPLSTALLAELHARIFSGVRRFAGALRGPRRGSQYLTFGPNRSSHRDEVPAQLEAVMQRAEASRKSLIENTQSQDYDLSAIRLGVWIQAEVIRIHPFEDGNGRASRLLTACALTRLGVAPIPIDAAKQEYIDLLNAYFAGHSPITKLVDLHLRIAAGIAWVDVDASDTLGPSDRQ